MKKIKLSLTAFAVIAVAGGALAFKAHTTDGTFYCSSVSGSNGGNCGTTAARYGVGISSLAMYCVANPPATIYKCPDTITDNLVRDAY